MAAYRKATNYRKPRSYRGSELAPGGTGWSLSSSVRLPWVQPAPADAVLRIPIHAVQARAEQLRAPWGTPAPRDQAMAVPMRQLDAFGEVAALPWGTRAASTADVAAPWEQLDARNVDTAVPWGDIEAYHANEVAEPWRSPKPHARTTAVPWQQLAAHVLSRSALWRSIVGRGGVVALPWGPMAARQSGIRIDWPVDPPPGTDPITVPILPVYVMIPTITAVRLSDSAPLPILGVSLQCDLDSWAWTFTAPMAFAGKALVDPATATDPVAIAITVNGYTWTLLVEGYDDNRRFGSKTLTIRGRSRSAMLAQPYAPTRTFTHTSDRTAAQLVDDELFGTGWTALWTAPDWLVPGGTFSYADLAPIDAISRIADAIGAAVLTHRTDLELQVVPQYADSPWAWDAATPYAILPAAILAAGDGSWQGGSNANGVVVRSQNDAFAGLIKITGTDGASELEMVVDSLVVHADAGRERGRVLLAKAGKIKTETRTLPLFPSPADPGLIPLGALVEIEDATPDPEVFDTWRGMVRGIRIEAQKQGGANSVRQVLQLERQFR